MSSDAVSSSTRRVAMAFLSAYWRADLPAALALCHPEAIIEFPKSISIVTPALIRDVLPGIFADVYRRFVDARFDVSIDQSIAQGGAIFVEYRASGDLTTGRRFDCRYGVVLQVKEERVTFVRQYTDTQYISTELMPP